MTNEINWQEKRRVFDHPDYGILIAVPTVTLWSYMELDDYQQGGQVQYDKDVLAEAKFLGLLTNAEISNL